LVFAMSNTVVTPPKAAACVALVHAGLTRKPGDRYKIGRAGGCSSVAERQLPKLYVVSSILIARSNFAKIDNYVGRMVSYEHLIGKNEC